MFRIVLSRKDKQATKAKLLRGSGSTTIKPQVSVGDSTVCWLHFSGQLSLLLHFLSHYLSSETKASEEPHPGDSPICAALSGRTDMGTSAESRLLAATGSLLERSSQGTAGNLSYQSNHSRWD